MDDLTAFVTARLDEAEAFERAMLEMLAKAGPGACIAVCFDDGTSSNAVDWNPWDVIGDYDPARALREVAAKRSILAEHGHYRADYNVTARTDLDAPFGCSTCHIGNDGDMYDGGWCTTLRALAAIWSDHPDYRAEWAVAGP
jgi:hypothetical protein